MSLNIFKEKILFSRVKNKDRKAFIEAYDLYTDEIFRFVFFKVGSREEAEDITSSVFLKTWNHIQNNTVTDSKTLRALIYKIARNTVIDYYRENSKKNVLTEDEFIENDIEDERQDILKNAEVLSDMSIVEQGLSELKDEYREVIILRFVEELSISEIADVLKKTKGNVRILTFRALKALKDLISSKYKK